jgi:AcrR family transcriptional regulator
MTTDRNVRPTRPSRRGRRPIAEVRENVLTASGSLLLERGYRDFTVEAVIGRAGVSSATMYKYWPSRGALALDGFLAVVGDDISIDSTGDIREDLRRVIQKFIRFVDSGPGGRTLAELIGAAQTDPDLAAQFSDHYFGPRRAQALQLLTEAQATHQLDSTVDPDQIVDLIWGPLYIRLLLPNLTGTLTPTFGDAVLEHVLPAPISTRHRSQS